MAKANIFEDMRQKIVSASGGSYEYEKLRDALAAISPTINCADHQGDKDGGQTRLWKGRRLDHRVNMVADFGNNNSENEALAKMRWPWPKPWSRSSYDPGCLRRSMVERARGFQKAESSEERAKGISNVKQRVPCNACRAHGKTVYGHWRSDKECPYFEETKKKKEKSAFVTESGGPAEDRAAFVVGQASSVRGMVVFVLLLVDGVGSVAKSGNMCLETCLMVSINVFSLKSWNRSSLDLWFLNVLGFPLVGMREAAATCSGSSSVGTGLSTRSCGVFLSQCVICKSRAVETSLANAWLLKLQLLRVRWPGSWVIRTCFARSWNHATMKPVK